MSRNMRRWADRQAEHGFRLIRLRHKNLWDGFAALVGVSGPVPFFEEFFPERLRDSLYLERSVYRVVVEDSSKTKKAGWAVDDDIMVRVFWDTGEYERAFLE